VIEKGLVSILIPNYNYGRYLEECFESVLKQTYRNIEVIFRDNASTDDSWKIAKKYKKIMKDNGITFYASRNKINYGSGINCSKCYKKSRGEFVYYLSSDDTIEPDFIKKNVSIMTKYPNVSMVISHRNEIRGDKICDTVPFYNKSCIINGEEQAAVFMMSGVGVLGQMFFRKSVYEQARPFQKALRFAGDWHLGFVFSALGDVGYIKEALYNYRIHSESETHLLTENMTANVELYIMLNDFVDLSKKMGMSLPISRYEEALKKLAGLSVRYAVKMLKNNIVEKAQKYLHLAVFYDETITENEDYQKLKKCCEERDDVIIDTIYAKIGERKISYDPPKGHIELR